MTKRKKIAIAVLVLPMIAATYAFYLYTRLPADIREETVDIKCTASELAQSFNQDEESANRIYVGKVLLVTGKLTRIDYDPSGQATVYLDTGDPLATLVCSFYKQETPLLKNILPGTTVHVKGVCNGKLMDVVLNKCSMAK